MLCGGKGCWKGLVTEVVVREHKTPKKIRADFQFDEFFFSTGRKFLVSFFLHRL